MLGNGPLAAPPVAAEATVGDAGLAPGLADFLFRKLNRPNRDGRLAAVVGMVLGVAGWVVFISAAVVLASLLFRCTILIPSDGGVWSALCLACLIWFRNGCNLWLMALIWFVRFLGGTRIGRFVVVRKGWGFGL